MTRQEYTIYCQKYKLLENEPFPTDLETMIQLQDAALRAFVQGPGYERLWDEETTARIERQKALSRFPRHGR